MKLKRTVRVNAPPARIWQVMTDVGRWPEWTPSAISVDRHNSGPLRLGSSVTIALRGVPKARWVVTSLVEGSAFRWESHPRVGPKVVAGHVVEPDGAGSIVTLTIEPSGLVGALLSPLIVLLSKANVEAEAAGLKRRCEEGGG